MPRDPRNVDDPTLSMLIAPGLGPATIRKLRSHFGSAAAAVGATVGQLTTVDGIGHATARAIREALDETHPGDERDAMEELNVEIILSGDDDYPPLLAVIPDPPEALFIRGQLGEEPDLAVAIVGSRRCTSYGREQAGRLAALLAQSGLTIVSGGALGIDSEAHRGALRVGGRTVVVLGCGHGVCYPRENEQLFERTIESGGALLSEHPMHAAPKGKNFPRRNRIISGLSLGVLVIEAAARSGALITARIAAEEQGREVMALPGRVDSPASAGCLRLIQGGAAALVVDHGDVLRQLDASSQLMRGALAAAGVSEAETTATLFDHRLTEGQQAIIGALLDAQAPMLVEQLAAKTGRPLGELMADLTLLEIRGRLRRDQRGIRLRS